MDSRVDIKALRDNSKLKAQGEAIAKGIAEYLKLQKATVPEAPPTTGSIFRVLVDGKQVGAYSSEENAVRKAYELLKKDKKKQVEVKKK